MPIMTITLQDRVEDLVGPITDIDALTSWLTLGAKVVIDLMPEDALEEVTSELSIGSNGYAVGHSRIHFAHKDGYGAKRVPPGLRAQVQDYGSIHYASPTDPVFIIYNQKMYIYPNGGTLLKVDYPEVLSADKTIAGLPEKYDQIVVYYASIQQLLSSISAGITGIDNIETELPDGFIKPTFEGDFSTLTTPLDTEEDIELTSAHIGRIRSYLDKYASELQSLSGETAIHSAKLRALVEGMNSKVGLLTQLMGQYKMLIDVHLGARNDI